MDGHYILNVFRGNGLLRIYNISVTDGRTMNIFRGGPVMFINKLFINDEYELHVFCDFKYIYFSKYIAKHLT